MWLFCVWREGERERERDLDFLGKIPPSPFLQVSMDLLFPLLNREFGNLEIIRTFQTWCQRISSTTPTPIHKIFTLITKSLLKELPSATNLERTKDSTKMGWSFVCALLVVPEAEWSCKPWEKGLDRKYFHTCLPEIPWILASDLHFQTYPPQWKSHNYPLPVYYYSNCSESYWENCKNLMRRTPNAESKASNFLQNTKVIMVMEEGDNGNLRSWNLGFGIVGQVDSMELKGRNHSQSLPGSPRLQRGNCYCS